MKKHKQLNMKLIEAHNDKKSGLMQKINVSNKILYALGYLNMLRFKVINKWQTYFDLPSVSPCVVGLPCSSSNTVLVSERKPKIQNRYVFWLREYG